jgi:hypothetical protein
MAFSASQTRAFNAIYSNQDASSRKVETLSSGKYFKHKLSIFDYLKGLREKGNFTASLGLNSAANGGTARQTENGRVTIWFSWDDKESSVTVSSSLSERMLSLCGDTDYRSQANGAVEALRVCYPLLTKAFIGIHMDTGVTMLAV